jgi:hypothetical protein
MAMNNTHTKKAYGDKEEMPVKHAERMKDVNERNLPGKYDGQLKGRGQAFANPMNQGAPAKIMGLDGLYDDIGEKSGFLTEGYLDKNGTPYGEAAKFNFLPPGMDISNQENAEIHQMPLRKLTAESYPGDGWMPSPRDIPE